ncbi:GNAT family N-acetyltransferase [Nevskia ramosa]|uniref:GNAT family N-acetyltransferase n=1 Tax=Nevskia ramosa TaxID=64002 RepID=UPI00041E9A0A|nr:GNAT family N-acetyltransferase [Nevskia ramosa]
MTAAVIDWRLWRWNEWSNDLLYAAMRLRSEIFVVEQNCVFPDMDGLDPACTHLCGTNADGELLAYARLLAPGVKYPEASIGRVITSAQARGLQLGRALMLEALRLTREHHPGAPIRIGAQQRLDRFYASLGFVQIDVPYLEDGIWHIDMRLDR